MSQRTLNSSGLDELKPRTRRDIMPKATTQLKGCGVNQLYSFQPLVFVPWKVKDKEHNALIGHQAQQIRIAAGKRLVDAAIDLKMTIQRISRHELGGVRWTSKMIDHFNDVFETWVLNEEL